MTPLSRTRLAELCHVGNGAIDSVVHAMARDKHVHASIMRRVNLEYATGRPANEEGTDAVDPPPLALTLLKTFAGLPAGSPITRPYREAVSLINEGIAGAR